MQLNYLDIEHFYHLPCHVYWKDNQGIYLGSNDYPAIAAGLKSKGSDFVGLSDLDICPEREANIFRFNDKRVLEEMNALTIQEEVKFLEGVKGYTVLSYKYPVFNKKNKPSSVLGFSFMLTKEQNFPTFNLNNHLFHLHERHINGEDDLTPRQMDCLYYLVLGKTAKQIAQTLNLSTRTVEHHLNAIKTKYACTSRSDLIAKALQMPYVKTKLLAL